MKRVDWTATLHNAVWTLKAIETHDDNSHHLYDYDWFRVKPSLREIAHLHNITYGHLVPQGYTKWTNR